MDIYTTYAHLNHQIALLETEKEELRKKIAEKLEQEGIEKLDHETGSFYFTERKKWTYSDKVKTLEDKVKLAKTKEEEKGLAVSTITKIFNFRTK